MQTSGILERLEIEPVNSGACHGDWIAQPGGGDLASISPRDGCVLGHVQMAARQDYEEVLCRAAETFRRWRMFPAPKRGEIVRQMAEELRRSKDDLGALVSLEMGKILAEGRGEVQEMIDVADFAVGLSRQLYGLTMQSERPAHRMYEQWHPLGPVGVISAFNFPVAVWSWNAMIAAVCGDVVVWKPSSETPLTAIAVQKICNRVLARNGWPGVFNLVIGRGGAVGDPAGGSTHPPGEFHRLHRSGPPRGPRGCRPVGPHHPGTGRQQRRLGDERCQPGSRSAGRAVRRGRHRRTALHHHPASLPSAWHRAKNDPSAGRGLPAGAYWRPVGRAHRDGPPGKPAGG